MSYQMLVFIFFVFQIPEDAGCPLCRNGLDQFGYRDVLLLRQFLTPKGYLMGRRITGVCHCLVYLEVTTICGYSF